MSKRNIKDAFLLLTVLLYSVIYRIFIFQKALKYSESITGAFIILLAFISIILLGFRKNKTTKIKHYISSVTFCIVIAFFVISYGLGLAVGFLKNAYSLTLPAIVDNIFSPIVIIICTEIFRYVVINGNKDKKIVIVLTTIVLMLFELSTSMKAINFADFAGVFRVATSTILPIISKNIVLSYLTYHVGYKPTIFYRLVMDLYAFVMPIIPDLGDYLNSMIGIGLPFLIYIYAARSLDEYNNGIEKTYGKETFRLVDLPIMIFIALLVCLISGFFPYYMIGIGSESMFPKINKGDAVIIHKIKNKKDLKTGDIIAFKLKEKTIVHRLVEIEKVDGVTYYRTKGDANNSRDSINLTFDSIEGVVKLDIPYIAYPTIYLTEFLNGER
ncbi:MAG: signal peptidase I [Bacilli bacterium]|nr:signal peptidase I [Bacilli bacterium]